MAVATGTRVGAAALGKMSYNGYEFDGAINVKVEANPVRDEADRTVIYIRYEITVHAVISGGKDVANNNLATTSKMDEIREKLTCDGGILIFENKGFGTKINSNQAGYNRDVCWGPKTQLISWEPLGDTMCAEVIWKVTTCLPRCLQSSSGGGILALNYEVDYAINQGYTTRSITGYLQIPLTRQNPAQPCASRKLVDCADVYRRMVQAGPPQGNRGFKRHQSWRNSKDKSRLDFSIVDEQIRSRDAYPVNVANISGTHNVSLARRSSKIALNDFSMTVEPVDGQPGGYAWIVFLTELQKRVDIAKQGKRMVLLQNIEVSEQLFDLSSTFTVTYTILSSLNDFIGASGLWTPLGDDWGSWRASQMPGMFNQRGNAGLELTAGNDAIVDLCGSIGSFPVETAAKPTTRAYNVPTLSNQYPAPANSYLKYDVAYELVETKPVVRQTPLSPPPSERPNSNPNDTTPYNGTSSPAAPAEIQVRSAPSCHFLLCGEAIRAGYEVPRPAIRSIGGQQTTEVSAIFQTKIVGNFFNIPIYAARWAIGYVTPKPPGSVKSPDNPVLGVKDGKSQ